MQEELLKVSAYNSTFDKEEFNYKDNFYVNLIDVYINCTGRMIGAHKFILANRSPFYKELLLNCDPDVQTIDVGLSYEMTTLTMGLIYGETVDVKETDIAEFTRACSLLKVSFIARFPGDIEDNGQNTVSSGLFPSDMGIAPPPTPRSSSSASEWHLGFRRVEGASSSPSIEFQ